jgi:WhiB family redox-sensing transcriptional regulator
MTSTHDAHTSARRDRPTGAARAYTRARRTGKPRPGNAGASTPRHAATPPATAVGPRPGAWTESALCAQADPDAWFPDKGGSTTIARLICGACPVRAQCLDYALSGADTWGGISTGIWGGTTPRERAAVRRARKAAAA